MNIQPQWTIETGRTAQTYTNLVSLLMSPTHLIKHCMCANLNEALLPLTA